jgi:hypothetical protein
MPATQVLPKSNRMQPEHGFVQPHNLPLEASRKPIGPPKPGGRVCL